MRRTNGNFIIPKKYPFAFMASAKQKVHTKVTKVKYKPGIYIFIMKRIIPRGMGIVGFGGLNRQMGWGMSAFSSFFL
jgi:hypothetical protein